MYIYIYIYIYMKDDIISKRIKLQEYTCKQSKHGLVPKLPLRGI